MKNLFILFIPFFASCATHAPMSEMVMFNQKSDGIKEVSDAGIAFTYLGESISEDVFQEKNEGDYYDIEGQGVQNISVNYYLLNKDNFSFSASLGKGLGIDATTRLKGNFYSTALVSVNRSGKLILQNKLINQSGIGFAPGMFISLESRGYDDFCLDDSCYRGFGPDKVTKLYTVGIRGRFIIRDQRKTGIAITGVLEIGQILEIREPYLGFNVSLTAF